MPKEGSTLETEPANLPGIYKITMRTFNAEGTILRERIAYGRFTDAASEFHNFVSLSRSNLSDTKPSWWLKGYYTIWNGQPVTDDLFPELEDYQLETHLGLQTFQRPKGSAG